MIVRGGTRRERTIRTRMLVGADVRDSRVAPLVGRGYYGWRHARSSFWAYFRNVEPAAREGRFRIWFLGPMIAVGCGWALQSAEWLAGAVGGVIWRPRELERWLARYRASHRNTLLPHHFLNCSYSTGRRFNPIERLMLSAAARDARMATHFEAFGSRTITVGLYASPRTLLEVCMTNARHRLRARRLCASHL